MYIFQDLSKRFQYYFQDPATPAMEGIINLHNDIFFILIFVFVIVLIFLTPVMFVLIVLIAYILHSSIEWSRPRWRISSALQWVTNWAESTWSLRTWTTWEAGAWMPWETGRSALPVVRAMRGEEVAIGVRRRRERKLIDSNPNRKCGFMLAVIFWNI